MSRKINIQLSKDTHSKLENLGHKGQSFDDIVVSLIHQRNILAIHEICKDIEEVSKSIVLQVFDTIDYTIPTTFVDYDGEIKDWESDPVDWALEMAQDEDFVGNSRDSVPVSEIITNVYCLLEQINAPTWGMGLYMKNPFSSLLKR